MAHLKTQMDLLAKHLLSNKTEIVKAVEFQGTVSTGANAETNYVKLTTKRSCLAITTQSGKILSGPSMGKAIEKKVNIDESEGSNPMESEKMDGFVDISEKKDKKNGKWSVKRPVGILHDVPLKVDDFILPADFVILDCDVDFEVPIFLGRRLLAMERVLVDMDLNELKFRKMLRVVQRR
ncbi:uncharacterized protein LOC124896703 [Capsicum annuum]|uniref:uncharacterized protein LOC124896703 n=1 Tax=Capsicum annuum TaxID=4072 RepID=UPI001FB11EBF|nr:uncharacterized protein LOC124896703 [Capsicum annuum]